MPMCCNLMPFFSQSARASQTFHHRAHFYGLICCEPCAEACFAREVGHSKQHPQVLPGQTSWLVRTILRINLQSSRNRGGNTSQAKTIRVRAASSIRTCTNPSSEMVCNKQDNLPRIPCLVPTLLLGNHGSCKWAASASLQQHFLTTGSTLCKRNRDTCRPDTHRSMCAPAARPNNKHHAGTNPGESHRRLCDNHKCCLSMLLRQKYPGNRCCSCCAHTQAHSAVAQQRVACV